MQTEIIKDTNKQSVEQSQTETKNENSSNDEIITISKKELESIKNYAAAKARISTEKVYGTDFVEKEKYEALVKERDAFLFEKNKEARFAEYQKFGGLKDGYSTFCKLNPEIINEPDDAKRKVLFEKAVKDDPILFRKAIITSTQTIMSNVKQEDKNNNPYYFDENGVLRSR